MNIKQLEAFLLVAELRNFTKTAAQLGMSQPAVSFQIKALEEELGVTLLERNEKKVLLTEAGRLLYPEIKQVVRHYRKIRAMVNELQGLKSGHLMLGATSMPAEYLLPIFIGGFREQYPGVRVSLQVGNSTTVARWLRDREIDLGVLGTAAGGEGIEYHPWLEDELIFIVPSWHPWAGGNISLEELVREPLIIRESGSGTRQALEAKLAEHNVTVEHFPGILELGSNQSMVRAVQAGLGIAAVSSRMVHESLATGKVARVIIPELQIRYHLYVAWPHQVSNGLSATIFKSFLTDRELCNRLLGNKG
ncbi:selenium metabolism-associated LysR family transcriptional regulator [Desulfofundulus sp.]|uniref:selenium metabolism-associated LysR family transcriptional regulator n=1 Tax=Desulfofundulus sp. TaxID=2282750 RepID=UPI003C72D858